MEYEGFENKFMDALKRTIITARILALMDGTKTDIAYFLDQADFLLSYYLNNELDAVTLQSVMTSLGERAPDYRAYLLGERPPRQ